MIVPHSALFHTCHTIQSGRPVLFVGSERSDVHLLCARGLPPDLYFRAGVGDPAAVATALAALEALPPPASGRG